MKIVGLAGFAGSGKDTLANMFYNKSGKSCTVLHFADTLKDLCHSLVGWGGYPPENMKQTPIETEVIGSGINNKRMMQIQRKYIEKTFDSYLGHLCTKDQTIMMVDNFYKIILKNKKFCSAKTGYFLVISPRKLYQLVGTECCRAVYPTIWVDDINHMVKLIGVDFDYVLIPDVRFDDEAAICDTVVWVERNSENLRNVGAHKSESSLSKNMIDFTIHNKENGQQEAFEELCKYL